MKRFASILLALCVMVGLVCIVAVPASAEEDNSAYAPPPNLGQLSQAEQLAYFNLVVNRVRAERPGFQQRERSKIDSVQTSSNAMNALLPSLINILMPGDWADSDVAVGQTNVDLFMSKNANASDLRPQDITSIACEKQGDNWVIELYLPEEINPALGLDSAAGRIAYVLTREELVEELSVSGLKVGLEDTAIRYGNGFARVTVNEQGQVLVASNGCQITARTNINISFFNRIDVVIAQNSEWQYACFDWAPEEPFPPGAEFPPAGPFPPVTPLKWYQRLPAWLQWILRYLFFGWIWMK